MILPGSRVRVTGGRYAGKTGVVRSRALVEYLRCGDPLS